MVGLEEGACRPTELAPVLRDSGAVVVGIANAGRMPEGIFRRPGDKRGQKVNRDKQKATEQQNFHHNIPEKPGALLGRPDGTPTTPCDGLARKDSAACPLLVLTTRV